MSKGSQMTRSTSMEELREKNARIEAELSKLGEEMKETSRRQEESNKRLEEKLTALLSSNSNNSSKEKEDRLAQLEGLMERTMKLVSSKFNTAEKGEASTHRDPQPANLNGAPGEGRQPMGRSGQRVVLADPFHPNGEQDIDLDSEEARWTEAMERLHRGSERERESRREQGRETAHVPLPRLDFPKFDGTDPIIWRNNCEFYFDMYQIPENYKTRMAVMNFSEDLHEWYMGLVEGQDQLAWPVLVEEVLSRFQPVQVKHPVDEFKRVHQTGKVDEYIKRFDKARLKLLRHNPVLNEEFFIAGFVSGLKEELRSTMELFELKKLNSVFVHALKVEANYETQNRRPKLLSKPVSGQNYPAGKRKEENDRREGNYGNQYNRPWQSNSNFRNPEFQRRRALGLCDKCDEKYYPGHQCAKKLLNAICGEQEELNDVDGRDYIVEEVSEEEIEQAVVGMFNSNEGKKGKMMKFKGQIGRTPICALLDSGSTHSFVHPNVLHEVQPKMVKTVPMIVTVANGAKMVTERQCEALQFSIQGQSFEKDMRVLDVQGYDMILGVD